MNASKLSLGAASCNYSNASITSAYETSLLATFCIAMLILILSLGGIVFNAISIHIYLHRSMRHIAVNILLAGLSGIDLVMLVLVVPVFVCVPASTYLQQQWLKLVGVYTTVYLYPLLMTAHTMSTWSLVAITVERFAAVCYPFSVRKFDSPRIAIMVLVAVLLSAIVFNLVRFWEYEVDTTCKRVVVKDLLRYNNFYFNFYYTGLFLFTHFLVPCSILVVMNTVVAVTIYKATMARCEVTSKERGEYSTATMMMVIILIFVLCNSLLLTMNLREAIQGNDFTLSKLEYYIINDCSNLLVVLNSCTNWVVYYIFGQKYRGLFQEVLGCCRSKNNYDGLQLRTACTVRTSKSQCNSMTVNELRGTPRKSKSAVVTTSTDKRRDILETGKFIGKCEKSVSLTVTSENLSAAA